MTRWDTTRTITRRTILGGLAGAGIGYAMWPIRPRHSSDVPAGRVSVRYWEKWTGTEGLAMQRIVDQFNASQSDIWVTRIPVADIGKKTLVAIAGGDPPDLVGLFDFNIPQFAESGAIRALDELDRTLDIDDYAPAVRGLIRHEGRTWAGISTCHTLALYYNRRLFDEAGLDPDVAPATVEELDRANEALAVFDGDDRLERAGLLPNIPDWWPYCWPVMFGGSLYDRTTNTATILDAENVRAFEWIASFPERFGREAIQAFASGHGRSYLTPQDPFLRGRVAMVVQGPWLANFIGQFAPDLEYGCAPMPVVASLHDPTQPVGMLEADVLMIPRGSREPHAALEFIRHLQRQAVVEQLSAAHSKGTPLSTASPAFRTDHPNAFVDVHDAIARSPRVMIAPRTRVWKQYSDLIVPAFQGILDGQPVRPELEAVQERVQYLLDLSATRRAQRVKGATP